MDETEQEYDAIHFDSLWATALDTLRTLAGQQWTEFGEHDPGVTFLQALTYNVADLAYRHTHPLKDLLTLSPEDVQRREENNRKRIFPLTFGPDWALTCSPVTENDYRRVVLDLRSDESTQAAALSQGFYFMDAQLVREPFNLKHIYSYRYNKDNRRFWFDFNLLFDHPHLETNQFCLLGGYHLYVAKQRGIDEEKAKEALQTCLQNNRNLCEHVRRVIWLTPQNVDVQIDIELDDEWQDPVKTMAALYQQVDACIRSPTRRAGARQLIEQGIPAEAVYDGPRLQNGWITSIPDPVDYTQSRAVDISGLAQSLLALAGVERMMKLQIGDIPSWTMAIDPACYPVAWGDDPIASLTGESPKVRLFKRGKLQIIDPGALKQAIRDAQSPIVTDTPTGVPIGRWRGDTYAPASNRIPPCYGLQDDLKHQENEEKKRLQRQYQFFLPFEQWIANGIAQAANVAKLLAFDRYTLKQASPGNVWGFQWPYLPDSRLNELFDNRKKYLTGCMVEHSEDWVKELAIIDYLLGYFGVQQGLGVLRNKARLREFIQVQQGYLEHFCTLTYNRANVQIGQISDLQKRIAARLGIGAELFALPRGGKLNNLPFYLIEYRLLLPPQPRKPIELGPASRAFIEFSDEQKTEKKALALIFREGEDVPEVGQLFRITVTDGSPPPDVSVYPWAVVSDVKEGVLDVKDEGKLIKLSFDLQHNNQLYVDAEYIADGVSNKARQLSCETLSEWMWGVDYPLIYAADQSGLIDSQRKRCQIAPSATAIQIGDTIAIPSNPNIPGDLIKVVVEQVNISQGTFVAKCGNGAQWPGTNGDGKTLRRCYVERSLPLADPFSFSIGVVLNRENDWFSSSSKPSDVIEWVEQIVRDEIPCHIQATVHWLNRSAFRSFGHAYDGWQNSGCPFGNEAYQLLELLSLSRLPDQPAGIGTVSLYKTDGNVKLNPDGTYQDEEAVKKNEVMYILTDKQY
ncbi:hypothetical protein KQH49_00115 [Mycetohabitans sp. B5]|uniref:Uncharacterized protein n=1 Tax=Mycetohabitans endofungorum TaxID=417203 RepID=A0A2P5KD64_9BURK|nr:MULTISPECIES: hypothetical protein [Mycetohabitans]MCG1053448.1 hypothetical protein [Mycetohabitans sp. B5]PPB84632.1 hypothetical protein B0O95_10229 [Mycetohabitans endofungorum]